MYIPIDFVEILNIFEWNERKGVLFVLILKQDKKRMYTIVTILNVNVQVIIACVYIKVCAIQISGT